MREPETQRIHTITIPATNLSRFLERVAALVDYSYNSWDADAIHYGLRDSKPTGFDYTFHADTDTRSIAFHFVALPKSNDIAVTFRAAANDAVILLAFGELMHDFTPDAEYFGLLNQIDAAFCEPAPPSDDPFAVIDCSPEHLAICEEHREALAFFQQPDWMNLLQNNGVLPTGYATIAFLSDNAARFAFPAYLASGLRYPDFEILQVAIDRTGTDWLTPKGHELVALAQRFDAGNSTIPSSS
jgi:hypothetical protein